MITKEQSEEIKKQLFEQIQNLPQENKEQVKQQIQNLNEEQLEEFLKQNKIQTSDSGQLTQDSSTKSAQDSQQPSQTQCVFCSITKNEMPSYKIAENKKAIAILELNPLTKGHVLIIPIEHTSLDKLPKSALSLAQKLTKKMKTKLKPEDIKIETSSFQGHAIINIVPLYKDHPPEKRKAEEQELIELQKLLETKKRNPRAKTIGSTTSKKSLKGLPKISFRIP